MGAKGSQPKTALALVGAILAVLAAIVAASVYVSGRTSPRPAPGALSLAWERGACVSRDGVRFGLVPCGSADGRVLSVVGDRPEDCPADTDEIVGLMVVPAGITPAPPSPPSGSSAPPISQVSGSSAPPVSPTPGFSSPPASYSRTACVRNLAAPHPGDPGAGGGVLRAGDCVTARGGERPCSSGGWYGRALAVVERAGQCPAATLDSLAAGPRTIVCLGREGRIPAVGDCVAEPRGRAEARGALGRIPCGSARAWAKVTARTTAAALCPPGSDRYLQTSGQAVYRPVTCLRRIAVRDSP
ncbi:hypothetical protein AB0D67_30980 [Streptosporangium sp. NPDC048047]|uniref:hypothetical protein n=1 Tax=Streptosporangium sp. NPDC048047 TaxID=3155748 RepID=UPI003441474E